MLIGHLAVAAAFVGIFVPLWPTTPFLLLAATCYSRGSRRFNRWLLTHPRFGPIIAAWNQHRAIPRHAKILAALSLAFSVIVVALTLGMLWGALAAAGAATLLSFILSRPSGAQCVSAETGADAGAAAADSDRIS